MFRFLICVTACERFFLKLKSKQKKFRKKTNAELSITTSLIHTQLIQMPKNEMNQKFFWQIIVFLCLNFTYSVSEPWPVSLVYDSIRLQWSLKSINLIHSLLSFFSVFRFILRSEVVAAAPGHQDDSDKHSESDSVTQIVDGASYCEVDSIWVRKRVMTIKGQLWHRWSLTNFFLYQRKCSIYSTYFKC